MVRGFETGSDNERIDELQRQLDDIIDSQINSVGGNEDISIDSTRGSRNNASGDAGGVRSNQPVIHQITDVDEGGTPTGVFDKINLVSSMIIVDFSTPAVDMELRFIQGTAKDGAKAKITPKLGRTLIIKSGGNILTSDDITVSDTDYYELVKYSEAETGVTGGAYKIFLSGGGTGGQTPWLQQIEGAGFVLNQVGKIVIQPIQTNGLEGILELIRNDTNPSDGNTLGKILFRGPDSGATLQTWASIDATYENTIAGLKQGQLTINVQKNNSLLPIIDYTGDDATFRFSSGVDVIRPNANGTKELGTSLFFWDDVFTETLTLRGSGGNTTGADRTIYADAITMVFNMPSGGFIHSVNNEIYSLLTNSELEVRTELLNGPTLRLRNNDQTPSNNDTAATILFTGEDSLLAERTYGAIIVLMDNVADSSNQSDMTFRAIHNNILSPFLSYFGVDDRIALFADLDLNFNDIIDMGGETINGIAEESVVDSSNDFLMFYDASVLSLRKLKFANLPPGGGSFLPLAGGTMTGAINMGNNNLNGVDEIIFDQANTSIEVGGNIVTHDFPSGGTWRIREGSTSRVILDDSFRITSSTNIGVFGSTAVAKQTVTGSKGGNAALDSLLTALANYGWITDNST